MLKRLVFGIGDLAEILYYHLNKENVDVEAFIYTIDSNETTFCGKPILDMHQVRTAYQPSEYGVYVTVGYKQMNSGRKKAFDMVSLLGYSILSYIHPTAQVSGIYGIGTIVLQSVVVEHGVTMGRGNILYPNAVISHHDIVGDFNFFAPSSCVAGRVVIGNYCFIGANATIKDHTLIADHTLVGANCYIRHDTNPYDVLTPAHNVTVKNHKSTDFM